MNSEQEQKIHAEALHLEAEKIRALLDKILGPENFTIGPDGEVHHKFSDLELVNLGENVPEEIRKAEKKLKKIYAEMQELGISGD
jgi:hypothetical protein